MTLRRSRSTDPGDIAHIRKQSRSAPRERPLRWVLCQGCQSQNATSRLHWLYRSMQFSPVMPAATTVSAFEARTVIADGRSPDNAAASGGYCSHKAASTEDQTAAPTSDEVLVVSRGTANQPCVVAALCGCGYVLQGTGLT